MKFTRFLIGALLAFSVDALPGSPNVAPNKAGRHVRRDLPRTPSGIPSGTLALKNSKSACPVSVHHTSAGHPVSSVHHTSAGAPVSSVKTSNVAPTDTTSSAEPTQTVETQQEKYASLACNTKFEGSNLGTIWNETDLNTTISTYLNMPGNVDGYPKYDNSLYIYAYNQIMGNSSGATGSKSCSLQDCPHPSDISTGLCKLGLNYLWTFLLNCIADFRDWAEDVTQTVLGEARDAILPDVSSMVEDFSPQLDFGALGKDELGMAMLAVAAEALDFLVPELGGEVQTIGDQIMDFQLDGTLFQFDKEEETADHLRTKMSQAIDSIITKIENSASILLEKTPVNTEANPYSQQPMNAIDLFQNGAYAAPKSWSSQVAPAKQRTEKVLAASIIGNIWKTQEVFVATATKQLTVKNGDTEKTNPKALCDYDTSGSEITSYCKDGRVYWLLQADALNHAWQKFKKPSGIDKLSSYANLQSSEIMTSVVTRYEKNLKDSLSAANAWSFMDADKDADRPLYIPLKVLDLDQIDKTIYVTTPSTVQESYKDINYVRGIIMAGNGLKDKYGNKFPYTLYKATG